MSNAVYHRAYDEREPIEVRIENDRIEIVSFPGPDRSITLEGLKNYRVSNRRYMNRRIGDFLKELHLTEGRNTGFKKILDALERNGSPKPEFETDESRSYFISRLYIHEGFLVDTSASIQNNETMKQVLKQDDYKKLYPVIEYIMEHRKITTEKVIELTGKSRTTSWRYLQKLREVNMLIPAGNTNKSLYIFNQSFER